MARITKIFTSGKIGPVITYEFRGKPCVRAKPEIVRQTKATKASAKSFGLASRMSRLLREGLQPVLPDPTEKDLMYRLNNTLFRWIQAGMPDPELTVSDPLALHSFECNLQSELSQHFKVKPLIEWKAGKAIIQVPAIIPLDVIKAPANTKTVHLNVCMAGCSIGDTNQAWNAEASVDIPYTNKEILPERLELLFKKYRRSINVVVIRLSYTVVKKGKLIRDDRKIWLPCGVVGVNSIK